MTGVESCCRCLGVEAFEDPRKILGFVVAPPPVESLPEYTTWPWSSHTSSKMPWSRKAFHLTGSNQPFLTVSSRSASKRSKKSCRVWDWILQHLHNCILIRLKSKSRIERLWDLSTILKVGFLHGNLQRSLTRFREAASQTKAHTVCTTRKRSCCRCYAITWHQKVSWEIGFKSRTKVLVVHCVTFNCWNLAKWPAARSCESRQAVKCPVIDLTTTAKREIATTTSVDQTRTLPVYRELKCLWLLIPSFSMFYTMTSSNWILSKTQKRHHLRRRSRHYQTMSQKCPNHTSLAKATCISG